MREAVELAAITIVARQNPACTSPSAFAAGRYDPGAPATVRTLQTHA